MTGNTASGEPGNRREPMSKQDTNCSESTGVPNHKTQQANENENERATQGSSNETLNERDDVSILGAVPSRQVPCSNTEGPGFDSPCTHQVDQATQTSEVTQTHGTSVRDKTLKQREQLRQERGTTAVTAVSVAVEVDIQNCEVMWRKVHTLMSDRTHPTEVQAAADAALELTSQVWHFEPSDAIEAVISKIERRPPLTFARPEVGTMLRYMSTPEDLGTVARHDSTTVGRCENPTNVRHRLVRLHERRDRNTRSSITSKADTRRTLPSEARPPLSIAKPDSGSHSARHSIRVSGAD